MSSPTRAGSVDSSVRRSERLYRMRLQDRRQSLKRRIKALRSWQTRGFSPVREMRIWTLLEHLEFVESWMAEVGR